MKCTNIKYTTVSNAIIYSKFRIVIMFFSIYPVTYGVGFTLLGLPIVKWISNIKQKPIVGGQYFSFTLLGLPIVKWISNIKQKPIVGGQYFNVPKPTGSG